MCLCYIPELTTRTGSHAQTSHSSGVFVLMVDTEDRNTMLRHFHENFRISLQLTSTSTSESSDKFSTTSSSSIVLMMSISLFTTIEIDLFSLELLDCCRIFSPRGSMRIAKTFQQFKTQKSVVRVKKSFLLCKIL